MANAMYAKGLQAFLQADVDWLVDDIRAILVDVADYTVNLATHDFLDDVPSVARVKVSGSFGSKTASDGVADAADIVLTAVTGDPSEAVVIYKHTGVEATSALICYLDTATGLPVTPNGGDITLTWDNGANRIFKL